MERRSDRRGAPWRLQVAEKHLPWLMPQSSRHWSSKTSSVVILCVDQCLTIELHRMFSNMSIPREGVHLAFLLTTAERFIVSTPAIIGCTAALLIATTGSPRIIRDSAALPSATTLCWILGVAVARRAHKVASARSINNGVAPRSILWHDETIVVSGGSSGIGESIVQLIRSKSDAAKIIIIDIVPPKPACKCWLAVTKTPVLLTMRSAPGNSVLPMRSYGPSSSR